MEILTKLIRVDKSTLKNRNYISDSPHNCGYLYQCAIRRAELEAYLELTIATISLKEMSEWSRHIISMLFYENEEILTLVGITGTVTLGDANSCQHL